MRSFMRLLLPVALLIVGSMPAWSQVPTAIHAYELNGSLTDTFAGPDLTNNGATLSASGLDFAADAGPSLSNWLSGSATAGNYSLEYYFRFTDVVGYRKMVDFKDRTVDSGLYVRDGFTNFYNITGDSGTEAFFANTMTHVVLTRDDAFDGINVIVDGVVQANFNNGGGEGEFTGPNNIIHFFRDDAATSFAEASAGFVDFIRVYDRPLTLGEAQALYALVAVPEPTTIALGGLGLAAAIGLHRRRKSKRVSKAKVNPSV